MRKTTLLKMTSVEYDLDTSGGLMPQIQALLAPPATEEAKRLKKERERPSISHRRPGRAINHDTCDSCKEGGDLLCCDHCPAAFHLQCHDPPLEEDDLPLGEWTCHQCRMFAKEAMQWVDDDAVSLTSSHSRHSYDNMQLDCTSVSSGHGKEISEVVEMDVCEDANVSFVPRLSHLVHREVEEEKMKLEEGNDDGDDYISGSDAHSHPEEQKDTEEEHEEDVDESPLQTLIRVASMMNPKQFQLPNELQCTTVLPGSHSGRLQGPHKRQQKKEGNKAAKKVAHELDNGIVPLPARVCFECRKSCRKAPLIQCDFCSLLFHQDCLDPPLTVMPVGRWMCPNHPEHILDQKILSSVGLSERVKLWDKFSGNISQDAIKINFLRKIHRHHPPFRYKIKLPPRNRVQVPQAIKDQYKNPPKLLPRVNEPLLACPESLTVPMSTSNNVSLITTPTQEEQDAWLASIVSFHTEIARFLVQREISRSSRSDNNNNTSNESNAVNNGVSSSASSVNNRGECFVPVAVMTGPSAPALPLTGVTASNYACLLTKGGALSTAGSVTNSRLMINGSVHSQDTDVLPFPVLGNSAPNIATNGDIGESSPDSNNDPSVFNAGKARTVEGCLTASPTAKATLPLQGTCTVPSLTYSSQGKSIILSPVNKTTARLAPVIASSANCSSRSVATASSPVAPLQKSTVSKTPLHTISNPMFILQTKVPQYANTGNGTTSVLKSSGAAKHMSVNALMGKVGTASPNSSLLTTKVSLSSTINNSPAITNLNCLLQASIEDGTDVELSKLDQKLVQILAWQRLQQLLPSKMPVIDGETKPGGPSGVSSRSGDVRSRASLCPVNGKGQPTLMPYRVLSIGTGADMDMCLANYGHCNYVSPRHACIFYDEMTKHYELLNYSEHGTTVDNVLYSCDFSDKCTVAPPPTSVVAAVRSIIDKFRGRPEPTPAERLTMNSEANKIWRPCNCKRSSSSLIGGSGAGWEGTALLHHGSHVKCGCLQFVFSITECGTKDPRRIFLERKPDTTVATDG